MTLLTDALDRVARQVSISTPSSWVTATADEHMEVKDFLDETVRDVRRRVDWSRPIAKVYTLTSDGSETYDLPSNFVRLQRDPRAVYETTALRRSLLPVPADGLYTHIKEVGSTGTNRYYQVRGYEGAYTISIYREPTVISVTIHYISDVWLVNAGTEKSSFTDGDDALLLPRRLIEAGTVWRYRERRGLDYMAKQDEYEALLGRYAAESRTLRKVDFGGPHTTSPFEIPVPDYIPDS